MKNKVFYKSILICIIMLSSSSFEMNASIPTDIREEAVTYTAGGVTLKGYVAYDASITGKRPAILIVHEWWGLNDYPKMRARKLAELGYIAMAADVFGDGKIATNPTDAQELTTPFYKDPMLAKGRLDAAVKKIKEYKQTDSENIAVIGYCFGGYIALNYAKQGADLKGAVSFHGGYGGSPFDKNLLKAKVLICHGASDKFASQRDAESFKHKLDSIGADNTLKIYPNAMHAFTNPASTEVGKKFNLPIAYNADADRDSWKDMKVFFGRIFKK